MEILLEELINFLIITRILTEYNMQVIYIKIKQKLQNISKKYLTDEEYKNLLNEIHKNYLYSRNKKTYYYYYDNKDYT